MAKHMDMAKGMDKETTMDMVMKTLKTKRVKMKRSNKSTFEI